MEVKGIKSINLACWLIYNNCKNYKFNMTDGGCVRIQFDDKDFHELVDQYNNAKNNNEKLYVDLFAYCNIFSDIKWEMKQFRNNYNRLHPVDDEVDTKAFYDLIDRANEKIRSGEIQWNVEF